MAGAGKSLVVTTGTGSGKSLCFFVPIVDACIRARLQGGGARTRAIMVYPMNALANSQLGEIRKFLNDSGLPDGLRPTVARYTGQESAKERAAAAANPPAILLTNFMMLELLLTRQDAQDKTVIANAAGLRFIVLDELHTYRGRQGADVVVLVRRLRDRTGAQALSIGTSATMANEGKESEIQATVAAVASKFFGAEFGMDAVIGESLRRATDDSRSLSVVLPELGKHIGPLPAAVLRKHPLAIWAGIAVGLTDDGPLKRRRPVDFGEAVALLAQASGHPVEARRPVLEAFLTRASLPETMRGGTHDRAFLAFKLHRFISGSGEVFTTLRPAPRNLYLEGQVNDPKGLPTGSAPCRTAPSSTDRSGSRHRCSRAVDHACRLAPLPRSWRGRTRSSARHGASALPSPLGSNQWHRNGSIARPVPGLVGRGCRSAHAARLPRWIH